MKTVLIPKDNVSDLYEVDDEVKKNIEFLPMQSLSQVLAAALLKPKTVSAGHPRTRKVKPAEAAPCRRRRKSRSRARSAETKGAKL